MARRRPADLHVNHERWLISYADFITLLFAFFVVMYSISSVNEGKYRVLSSTLAESFNAIDTGGNSAGSADLSVVERLETQALDPNVFSAISAEFASVFAELIEDDLMTISSNDDWLQIQLKDSILFSSGRADVSRQAQEIFTQVADILEGSENPIQIEGFTDNVPISTSKYPSNWELSTARASAIVKWMALSGIDPSRLAAVGFGEHQPIATNNTTLGRSQNRRVAIMVARDKRVRPVIQNNTPPTPRAAAPASTVNNNETAGSVAPVELNNGNLLFTSDPDLPRNNN